MARDSYSYLHLLLMAGVVLVALGSKKVLAHTDEPLKEMPAIALCGGAGAVPDRAGRCSGCATSAR